MAKTHPNNPTLRNPDFAKKVFDSSHHPRSWLTMARRLRSSADAIFDRETPVAARFWDEMRRISENAASGSSLEDFDQEKFPHPNFDAAFMLIAFAVENLLKGIAVAKGLVTFSVQKLPGALATHDLRRLHQLAAPTTAVAPHVLDHLTYMAEWRARYPLPMSVEQFWPMDQHGNLKNSGYSWPQSSTIYPAT
ncbi:MAG: hypothetical protein WDO24_15745 [Pseudomonadota bacterium]